MTVARRLGVALALHLTLLVGLLVYHVRTIQRTVSTAHDLSDISARLILVSSTQRIRLAQLDETVAKFAITRDAGYLEKFAQLRLAFSVDQEQVLALPVSPAEGLALVALDREWRAVNAAAAAVDQRTPTRLLEQSRFRFDTLGERLNAVHEASRATMRTQLAEAATAADRAKQLSWIALLAALALSIATAVGLMRSIAEPLQRLAAGTREVARGRFGYRLDTRRGDEFAQVAAAFNTMTERLGALDQLKQDFVSTISHDLKSPLASIREISTLLLDEVSGPLSEPQRRALLLQRESADRLGRMIAKLLDLSRLEAGLPLDLRPMSLAPFLDVVATQAAPAARERKISIRHDVAMAADVRLLADEDRLRALIDNLIENAIKFSPVGGVIDVSVTCGAESVTIEVADRGPGIDPMDRERIFEPFHQTPAGRAIPARGIGLGLTICREIANAHRGSISVAPRDGGGSVFLVEIPLAFDERPLGEPADADVELAV